MAPKTAKAKKTTEANEAPKKGRGKAKQVDMEPEIDDLDVDEKIEAPVERKKRGKKAANDGNGLEDNGKEEVPPAKRGRKKVEEGPAEEEPELIESSADDASANAEDNDSADTNGDEPLKSNKGRKKEPKKETTKAEPKGRGRKAKPEPEPEQEDEDDEEFVEKPKGRGRGRKPVPKAEEAEPEDPKAKGKGRKKAPTKITKEKTPECDFDFNEDEPVEEIKKKETKGRKKDAKDAKGDGVEKDGEAEEVLAAKKQRGIKKEEKGKGDSKDDDVEEDIPEPKPKGRGRGQKKVAESTEEDDTESTNKRRRKPTDEKGN